MLAINIYEHEKPNKIHKVHQTVHHTPERNYHKLKKKKDYFVYTALGLLAEFKLWGKNYV